MLGIDIFPRDPFSDIFSILLLIALMLYSPEI
jgi:hypothetical protein